MSTIKLQINQIDHSDHSLIGEEDVQFILLNDLANFVSGSTKCSTKNKMKGRNGFWTHRYSPYDIEKVKRKKKSRKKMMSTGINAAAAQSSFGPTYSNFLFLDDMFTMSSKEVCEIARNGHGYKLILSNSQDSLKLGAIDEQSRITVSKAPGTHWIKYS